MCAFLNNILGILLLCKAMQQDIYASIWNTFFVGGWVCSMFYDTLKCGKITKSVVP